MQWFTTFAVIHDVVMSAVGFAHRVVNCQSKEIAQMKEIAQIKIRSPFSRECKREVVEMVI